MDFREATEARTAPELVDEWRREADHLEWRGLVHAAQVLRSVATDLEATLHRAASALLTLRQASAESGFSEGHLGRLVRDGAIPNAGRSGAPRIRRCDLPRKKGGLTAGLSRSTLGPSKAAVVRSIANQGD